MKKAPLLFCTRILVTLLLTLGMAVSAFAVVIPTDTDYLNMVKRGQNYLFSRQTPASYTAAGAYLSGGAWSDDYHGNPPAATAAAVAALLETGIPKTDQHIKDGMAYLRSVAKNVSPTQNAADLGKGGIYTDSGAKTYETGSALVAFAKNGDPADAVLVQNAANLLIARQAAFGNEAGGWDYSMTGSGSDLSNHQFGVMGLAYADIYLKELGMSLANETWKDKVFSLLQRNQTANGGFGYQAYGGYYVGGSMTGAGLWSLGLIGKHQDTLGNPKGADMKTKAVNFFNSNYKWDGNFGSYYSSSGRDAYYYFVFAMAKGLAISHGADQKVGNHDWVYGIAGVNGETVNGLKYSVYLKRNTSLEGTGDPTVATNRTYWKGNDGWIDGGDVLATSWVLMSLGLAVPNVPTPEKIVPPPVVDPVITPELEKPVDGNLVLKATLGVLIEPVRDVHNNPRPIREPIVVSDKVPGSILPVGAINFQLINVPVGGSVDLRVDVPAHTMNQLDAAFDERKAFVDKHGNPKKNVSWYKLVNGKWRPLKGVTIRVDKAASAVIVTLKDGGPADQDGVANGIIVDPGAPGFDTVSASPAGGSYVGAQLVTLTADVPTKAIYYTTNGTEPTTSSTLYANPITIGSNTTLKFFASDGVPGDTITEVYTITGNGGAIVAKAVNYPVAAPNSASYAVNLKNAATPSGTVGYTYTFGKINFVSTSITSITNSGDTYTVSGKGKLNSATGYDFSATLIKGTPASLGFEIRKTVGGAVVFTTAPKAVTTGTVSITP